VIPYFTVNCKGQTHCSLVKKQVKQNGTCSENVSNCMISVLFQVQFYFREDYTSVSVSDGNWQQISHDFNSVSVCYSVYMF
jgi:hypothetical protein